MLIKAVSQAVPTYAISVFKLPLSICEDIQIVIARFWRSSKHKEEEHSSGKMGELEPSKIERRIRISRLCKF